MKNIVVSARKTLIDIYHPTGDVLYDVIIPAIIFGLMLTLVAVFGFIGQNTACQCFVLAGGIHMVLSTLAWLSGNRNVNNGRSKEDF